MSSKRILVFADGTGNEGGLLPEEKQTNVYKLYNATRVGPGSPIDPTQQVAFYVNGIGTPDPGTPPPSWVTRKLQSLAQGVGFGLRDRITRCYMAIISVWQPGDTIYLFGFSRGAYTVRCLAHVLELMGIPFGDGEGHPISFDPKKLKKVAISGIDLLYRHGLTTTDDAARDSAALAWRSKHASQLGAVPYIMGVWDTVAAEGLDRIFPKGDEEHLPKGIMYVRHAMSIDEYRRDFKRVPWGGRKTIRQGVTGEPEPFQQFWFAGNHADIGGSYPENESRLSDIPLKWIADFLRDDRLPVDKRVEINDALLHLHPSFDGMMHDECMAGGVGGTIIPWGKTERLVDPAGTLHKTVIDRLSAARVRNFETYGPYRPWNLREHPQARSFFATPAQVTTTS